MTSSPIKYYHVYGDSDDNHEFYYGKEKDLGFDTCKLCKKVIDRELVIQKALPLYKSKFSRLFYYTWDGVAIVSDRFVEIYQKYSMRGLTFVLIPKLKFYYSSARGLAIADPAELKFHRRYLAQQVRWLLNHCNAKRLGSLIFAKADVLTTIQKV